MAESIEVRLHLSITLEMRHYSDVTLAHTLIEPPFKRRTCQNYFNHFFGEILQMAYKLVCCLSGVMLVPPFSKA